jgi:hypothetical protein
MRFACGYSPRRMYEDIHRRNPENMECLRYLVHLRKDSGLIEEANEWFKSSSASRARPRGARWVARQ